MSQDSFDSQDPDDLNLLLIDRFPPLPHLDQEREDLFYQIIAAIYINDLAFAELLKKRFKILSGFEFDAYFSEKIPNIQPES
jgi:hypothetical protein